MSYNIRLQSATPQGCLYRDDLKLDFVPWVGLNVALGDNQPVYQIVHVLYDVPRRLFFCWAMQIARQGIGPGMDMVSMENKLTRDELIEQGWMPLPFLGPFPGPLSSAQSSEGRSS